MKTFARLDVKIDALLQEESQFKKKFDNIASEMEFLNSKMSNFESLNSQREMTFLMKFDNYAEMVEGLRDRIDEAEHLRMSKYYGQVAELDAKVREMKENIETTE